MNTNETNNSEMNNNETNKNKTSCGTPTMPSGHNDIGTWEKTNDTDWDTCRGTKRDI